MSVPGTPTRQDGDSPPADPLTVKPARQRQAESEGRSYMDARVLHGDEQDSRPSSPFSFKRKSTASPSPSPAFPGGAAARRSLSNLFSRTASSSSTKAIHDPVPNKLSLPPTPAFGHDRQALLSPRAAATPARRISSGAARGDNRSVSAAAAARGSAPRNLSPRAVSPGGLRGRIYDWQRTAGYSPAGQRSPGVDAGGNGLQDENEEDYDDFDESRLENEPIIPKMLPELRTPEHQTPLPKLPIVVLAICMVGEFLSASVGGPFLFFMLEDLGVPGGGGESAIGFWAGIVSASFFLTQFMTALLWASAAARYGRRAVLFTSLLGNTLALLLYGSCKSVILMVAIRLFQGAFNGAVGVARSAVKDITDPTNEGRAYSIIGLAWSLGGILGPAIGGWTEHPVENLPRLFSNSQLFASFPYLLPCTIAATVTGTGCILSLFLSYDAGPREGGIRLPEEKDVERAVHKVASFPGSVKKKVSGYFAGGPSSTSSPEQAHEISSSGYLRNVGDGRRDSVAPRQRTSFAIPQRGSAYGYDPRRRDTALSRFRKMSAATSTKYAPDFEGPDYEPAQLNFAQKLLLANDEAGVFNITDLWVAAATREDGLPYTSANLEEDVFADGDESMAIGNETRDTEDRDPFYDEASVSGITPVGARRRDTMASGSIAAGRQGSPMRPSGRVASLRYRANSTVSTASRPAIYQNTGLAASPITSPAPHRESLGLPYQQQLSTPTTENPPSNLSAIPEGKAASSSDQLNVPGAASSDSGGTVRGLAQTVNAELTEKDPLQDFSILRDLPIKLIGQYSILALHGTIMDQIFMSFLVSKTAAGGLGLQASDYADIIACMCFFQMLFQFRFYPTVSMPLGRLTHVQMFRLGLLLYLIPYMLFPELRPLLGPNGERTGTVTFGLILLTATRYLANTCSYTAVMILINAMTPPPYIPMANGLAQSVVSLARFIGPLTGGIVWSKSIANGPEGYYVGFMIVAAICTLGFLHSFTIR